MFVSTSAQTRESTVGACCPSVTDAPLAEADATALAQTYAAIADPVRLRLLSLIAASGELCSCDLLEPLAKSQPTVSHHTKILAEAGLIVGDKRGRWVYWSIDPNHLDFVRRALGS
jgi:ArsR family transcriptional regulator